MTESKEKPREWFLHERDIGYTLAFKGPVTAIDHVKCIHHVIEKSAYTALQAENERLKAELEHSREVQGERCERILEIASERDALKKELGHIKALLVGDARMSFKQERDAAVAMVRELSKSLGLFLDYWHLGDSDETNALMKIERARAKADEFLKGVEG